MTRYVFEERNGLMVPVSETRGAPEPEPSEDWTKLDNGWTVKFGMSGLDRDIADALKQVAEWEAKIAHQQMTSYCYGEGFYDDDEPA